MSDPERIMEALRLLGTELDNLTAEQVMRAIADKLEEYARTMDDGR